MASKRPQKQQRERANLTGVGLISQKVMHMIKLYFENNLKSAHM